MFNNNKKFMTFGKMPIANNFLDKENFKDEFFFDMDIAFNEKYSLFMLSNHPTPSQMFNQNYKFFSSSSLFMNEHFLNFANKLKKGLSNKSNKIIEIGCNDGIMLKNFEKNKFNAIGFEPSKNVANIAKKKGLNIINDFFSSSNTKAKNFLSDTSLIYAANVICHIPNLDELISSIDQFLHREGIFVFEEPYLGSMFEKISYDQIYDEHVYIFSVHSILKIFKEFNFDLYNVEQQKTHGGSMRYFICRKSRREISKNVEKYLNYEKEKNIDNLSSCLKFKEKCEVSKNYLIEKLSSFKKQGRLVAGYAATSKSTTVLNYCNISEDLIKCIYDTTPNKINKFSPGMHIPIIDHKEFKQNYPDVAYLFAWNHKEEIFKKEKEFINNGGEWFSHVKL